MIDVRDKITLYESKNQLVTAAIDKIVVELFNKEKRGEGAQTVAFTGCSSLTGTTSTCIGLAIAIANTKKKTLLIDCDMRKIEKYKKLNEHVTVGLSDYLSQQYIGDLEEIVDPLYETNIENLAYIPCGMNTCNPTRVLCSTNLEILLAIARKRFDFVIIDLPSLNIVSDAQILFRYVDGIVLLSALGETRKSQIKEAKLKVAPYQDKYYGMIVNKIQPDMYRKVFKDYDYYFMNRRGEQKLHGSPAHKKYKVYTRKKDKNKLSI